MRPTHAQHPIQGKLVAVCGAKRLHALTTNPDRVTCTACARRLELVPGLREKLASFRQPALWSSDANDDEA